MAVIICRLYEKNDIAAILFFLGTYWIVPTTFWPLSKPSPILNLRQNVKFVYWFCSESKGIALIERVCSCVLKSLVGREILCTVNMIRIPYICAYSFKKSENLICPVSIVMCFDGLKNFVHSHVSVCRKSK